MIRPIGVVAREATLAELGHRVSLTADYVIPIVERVFHTMQDYVAIEKGGIFGWANADARIITLALGELDAVQYTLLRPLLFSRIRLLLDSREPIDGTFRAPGLGRGAFKVERRIFGFIGWRDEENEAMAIAALHAHQQLEASQLEALLRLSGNTFASGLARDGIFNSLR